ncbi:Na+-dependent transporter [Halogeometricum borinquense DSM 11551]|uniref:Na+-dependent transporter n=2 Tax=Halogeometricum borinquense TaxID=60847 RepID=E4NW65_HALBP|nr:bile acid:sodium symporter [Halogeometricum borinquense]ADQ69285.1 predicted Na+-dependent transporter [Halogeometricum borinquense DSM 11551]ELY31768.1 Na+-dependent transporter [Halogeometricum borinquense DSM 11551]RYJ08378.1 Na+-dependent transporter [Halogeometricum borinquense]
MSDSVVTRVATLVDEYLLIWVLLSVGVGLAVPSVAVLTPLSTPILAVMIGAVSLTLAPERFRQLRSPVLLTILVVQTGMPLLAFAIARTFGLSPALTAGFVVLGAVTPELVTPTMTELSGGDTALATVILVVVGLGTLVFVPGVVTVLLGASVSVDPLLIVEQLLLAVVLPMSLAVGVRYRWSDRIGQYDDLYPSVSGLMVILIIGIVAAANASLVRNGGAVLRLVTLGAVVLNCTGYATGWLVGWNFTREERIAATLSVGMRDFAVAAALLVGAGFPTAATLPAVVFGIIEMTTSAGLAKWFSRPR